jgi:cytoskeletal protein CcmA (bactofilin family)
MTPVDPLELTIFLLVCAALLGAPFLPLWWRWTAMRRGQQPVPQPGREATDLGSRVSELRREMKRLLSSGKASAERPYESLDEALNRGLRPQARGQARPVVVPHAAQAQQGIACQQPVLAADDLQLREGSELALVMSDGHLVLGPRSRIRGWAHADKTLLLGESSVAARQLSSGRGIALAWGCCFERMQAPVIVLGRPHARRRGDLQAPRPALPAQPPLPNATPWGATGWRVQGDCTIEKGHRFTGSLVVTGVLSVGAEAHVEGDIKAHGGVVIGAHAVVTGAVFCERDIRIFEEANVAGPVVSAGVLQIGDGVRLGSLAAPTSVHARVILAGDGVIAHGTVWAAQAGLVWGPP